MWRLSGANLATPPIAVDPNPRIYTAKSGKKINMADVEIQEGYALAKEKGLTTHAECRLLDKVWHKAGCDRYVTEQVMPPHIRQEHFDSGKTTEQCRAEVNAYYEVYVRDLAETGHDRAPNAVTKRHWLPELKECQNYDNLRIDKVIYQPTYRLDAILNRVEQGAPISEEDRSVVLKDSDLVATFPEHKYKRAYLAKREYFFQIAGGLIKPRAPAAPPPLLSCAEYQARLDELVKIERQTIEAQAALDRKVGEDNRQWATLNQRRIDWLWDWKSNTDGAKVAGCNIMTTQKTDEVVEK